MTKYYMVPGLGNSGEAHWQSLLEKNDTRFTRIVQDNWEQVEADHWVKRLEETLAYEDLSKVVLIGHSLGCLTIVKWALQTGKQVKGAVLVAPADMENPPESYPICGFSPIHLAVLLFKSIVITSSNDEWISLPRAQQFAQAWGSDFINIGPAGHISASSGYGKWLFLEKLLVAYFE